MKRYPITATFIDEITYDIPSSNWDFADWARDLDNMREVGIDTIVFIRGGFTDQTIYPSEVFKTRKEEDFLGFMLDEAEKRNMKVYIGLYITDLDWGNGDYQTEVEKNRLFIDEILSRYGSKKSFVGWYIPHEAGSDVLHFKEILRDLPALCKEKTPEKDVMISPYFQTRIVGGNHALSPEEFAAMWDGLLKESGKNIDICAFQDGTAPLDSFGAYFAEAKKVCDRYRIRLWANVETFERDVRHLYFPIPFDLLRRKIELAAPYVEASMTFEFSHFLSPQSIFPSARNLNKLYRKYYGEKDNRKPN